MQEKLTQLWLENMVGNDDTIYMLMSISQDYKHDSLVVAWVSHPTTTESALGE